MLPGDLLFSGSLSSLIKVLQKMENVPTKYIM